MLTRTVAVTFYLTCFTVTSAKMFITIKNCSTSIVDQRPTCVYNAGDFIRFDCESNASHANNMLITRHKDTITIGVFEGHTQFNQKRSLTVSQYFTEQQDGEKWICTVQTSKANEELIYYFKLRNGPNRMGLHSDIGKTDYTVVWIAIGCCSLISLLAVIAAVVAVKRITANRKPESKDSGAPVFSMYTMSSSDADDNDTSEKVYDSPHEMTYSNGRIYMNGYSSTSTDEHKLF